MYLVGAMRGTFVSQGDSLVDTEISGTGRHTYCGPDHRRLRLFIRKYMRWMRQRSSEVIAARALLYQDAMNGRGLGWFRGCLVIFDRSRSKAT